MVAFVLIQLGTLDTMSIKSPRRFGSMELCELGLPRDLHCGNQLLTEKNNKERKKNVMKGYPL